MLYGFIPMKARFLIPALVLSALPFALRAQTAATDPAAARVESPEKVQQAAPAKQEGMEQKPDESIKMTDYGIELYGRFLFESEGERYEVLEKNKNGGIGVGTTLVPGGAVLTVIKKRYSIGYYEGKVTVTQSSKVTSVPKIYFTLTAKGIEFHYPTEDGKYCGEKVAGQVDFPL